MSAAPSLQGSSRTAALMDHYLRNSSAAVLMYSVTSRSTFDSLPNFRERVLQVADVKTFPMVLVGNKLDLENTHREVTTLEAEELAKSWGIPFFESSAKDR